jgi:hypothetical protein
VIQQFLREQLQEQLKSGKDVEKIIQQVRRSLDEIKKLDPDIASIVRNCYEVALSYGFALMLCITVFAVVSSFFIKEKRLSR